MATWVDLNGQPIQPPKAYTDLGQHVTDYPPSGNAIVADWSKWLFGTRTSITLEVSRVADSVFKKARSRSGRTSGPVVCPWIRRRSVA